MLRATRRSRSRADRGLWRAARVADTGSSFPLRLLWDVEVSCHGVWTTQKLLSSPARSTTCTPSRAATCEREGPTRGSCCKTVRWGRQGAAGPRNQGDASHGQHARAHAGSHRRWCARAWRRGVLDEMGSTLTRSARRLMTRSSAGNMVKLLGLLSVSTSESPSSSVRGGVSSGFCADTFVLESVWGGKERGDVEKWMTPWKQGRRGKCSCEND